MNKHFDIIIAGAGAAGMQLAYRLATDDYFTTQKVLIIDQETKASNDRTWCYWERGEGIWDDVVCRMWKHAKVSTVERELDFPLGDFTYKMIRSADFYRKVKSQLEQRSSISFQVGQIQSIEEREDLAEVRMNESVYTADLIFTSVADFAEARTSAKYPFLIQHFGGWFIETEDDFFNDHSIDMMDFRVPQEGNTRFMYVLPLNKRRALVEYTLFSEKLLERSEYERAIETYLKGHNAGAYTITEKEFGQIPMTCFPFFHRDTRRIFHIGSAGGWTKPSTGYTFYHATKRTKMIAEALKSGGGLDTIESKRKYRFYDAVVLDLLTRRNDLGSQFFESVYSANPIDVVFDFLNEESKLSDELLLILRSKPRLELLKSAMRVLMKRPF